MAQESEELLMLLRRGLSAKQAEMLLEVPPQPRSKNSRAHGAYST